MMSSSVTFWSFAPPHAGYPKSAVSRNMARGRFLCVRDTKVFRTMPPAAWLNRAASVAVNATRVPW